MNITAPKSLCYVEESEKAGLKLRVQKMKIMAFSLITSWQIDGETMEIVTDFIFLGSKITVDDDCSHEIQRCLLRGRKAMTSLDSILKSRDIALLKNVHLVKAMVFLVVKYGCESWTMKKTECQRILMFLNFLLEKTKIMASSPISSWQIDGETMEQ